jgi:hypothetical protein
MIRKISTKTFRLSQEMVFQSSVYAVTKLHSKPYSMIIVQKDLGEDCVVTVQFCNWFYEVEQPFTYFTDTAQFYFNSHVNTQYSK